MPRDRKPSRPLDPKPNLRAASLIPRRFLLAIALAISVIFIVVVSLPASDGATLDQLRASYQQSAKQAKQLFRDNDDLPSLYNPLARGDAAKRPPDQKGAKHGYVKWFCDEQWQKPFSSAVTLDDERVVLPPLAERIPIYTYYNPTDRPQDTVVAEKQLLLDWRRAWWAQGLRPIVLGPSHAAKKQDMWTALQKADTKTAVKNELERWLAWSSAGGGILVNYLAFPMASRSDPFLKYLRAGKALTSREPVKLETHGNGFLMAPKPYIDSTLRLVFQEHDAFDEGSAADKILSSEDFTESPAGTDSIAYYDLPTVKSIYKPIADSLISSQATGLTQLHNLISAHLRITWQNQYPDGISITKPDPEHMTTLTSFAIQAAQLLSACPTTNPVPDSCPPNNPKCKPCTPATSMRLSLAESYTNTSNAFHLTPIPHPLTFATLLAFRDTGRLDPRFVRRKLPRDEWVHGATDAIAPDVDMGAQQRLVRLKELVTSSTAANTALWFTAERDDPLELAWILGFEISAPDSEPESPAPLQARLHAEAERERKTVAQKLKDVAGRGTSVAAPSDADLSRERTLIMEAGTYVKATGPRERRLRDAVEAWSMADLEAWRFVRAMGVRRDKEREDGVVGDGV